AFWPNDVGCDILLRWHGVRRPAGFRDKIAHLLARRGDRRHEDIIGRDTSEDDEAQHGTDDRPDERDQDRGSQQGAETRKGGSGHRAKWKVIPERHGITAFLQRGSYEFTRITHVS